MTPQEQYGGMLWFFCCFLTSGEGLTIDFNCIGSALTKFTPETREVFCGLKHFSHPSIDIVVSR